MLYTTGDVHGPIDIGKFSTRKWRNQKNLIKTDYIIVCGDFGLTWDKSREIAYLLDWINNKPFTTLFVDGNHEGYNILDSCSVEEWCGGKVHKIKPSVIHLMRGQVFDICGKRIFTMGGASSHDKEWRTEGKSWWTQEMPCKEEYDEAERNLDRVGRKVDYIFSHCAPTSLTKYEPDELTNYLQGVKRTVDYDKWFFGHYHVDQQFGDKEFCLYNKIVGVDDIDCKM